ncbi:MAG: OmpH family outer membrane protein [Polyangiaceae bacterium]
MNPSPRRRSSRIWAALLGGSLAFGAVAWATPAAAQTATMKMAVVDVRRAVLETEEGLRVQASLKKLFDSRQQDLDAKQVQLQKDKDALDKEIQAGKTAKDVLQRKLETLQKNAAEIQGLTYDYQREMSRKENELTTPILNKILGILKRIAATDGYDMIIDKSVAPYFRSDLELTDRAIQMYNAGSADAGSKPATPDPKKPGTPATPAPTTPAPKPATPAPTPAPAKK